MADDLPIRAVHRERGADDIFGLDALVSEFCCADIRAFSAGPTWTERGIARHARIYPTKSVLC